MVRLPRLLSKLATQVLGLGVGVVLLSVGTVFPGLYAGDADQPSEVIAMLWGEPIRADDTRILNNGLTLSGAGIILHSLFEKYAQERGVTVSDEEVALYAARLKETRERFDKRQVVYIKELKEALASGMLSEEESSLARRRIEGAERRAQNPVVIDPELEARARNEFCRASLQRYKTMQQLYRDYGGRVIFQQMGPEPLDAMHDFLKAEHAKGSFAFLDPEAEAKFWEYFTTTRHIYASDAKEIHRLMNTPWWLEPLPPEEGE